jgi:hypothetical protein
MKKAAAAIIAIGRALIEVKKILRHGAFGTWVKSNCGFSLRSAQNYMRAARLADKNATVALLPLGTSYRMTGRRPSRWMLNAAAERAADGQAPTEAEIEHLYSMMLRTSKARRARRMSQGLAQNAGIRTSDRDSRAQSAAQRYRASVADKISTFDEDPSRAKLAEEAAHWIFKTCGEHFARSLVALRDCGRLDDAVRVLKQKLLAPEKKCDPTRR